MKLTQFFHQHTQQFTPKRLIIASVGVFVFGVVTASALIFLVPKTITFSYSGETCARQMLLFPDQQTQQADGFTIQVTGERSIGDWKYLSTGICVEPTTTPEPGKFAASSRPFDTPVFAKNYRIVVGDPPQARQAGLVGQQISPALPVQIELSQADVIHDYELQVEERAVACEQREKVVSCDIADLQLAPAKTYEAVFTRAYKESSPQVLFAGSFETLLPLTLKDSSVKNKQVVYTTPESLDLTFALPVDSVQASLINTDTKQSIELTAEVEDTKARLLFADELERQASYRLTVEQAIAVEGNALDKPIVINFELSGGPKPKQVSVGSVRVATNAAIIVTLDQPIPDDVELARFASISGVSGVVSKQSATQLRFSLQAGLCQPFTLRIDEGLPSAVNSATSEAWQFQGRTVCGTSSIIGYSVQGRPLVAYYIGSGSKTILFTGGIHGNEYSGYQTMQAWADYLMAYGSVIPANTRVVVVPNLNPDGIATGTRNNVNDVNLARNYPSSSWSASIETARGVLPKGGGTSPGSEPETKAIMTLTQQLKPRLQVSFHSQGRLVGANKVADSVAIGSLYARTVGYTTMFDNAEAVMGYTITGEYEEWIGEAFGIPAILIELPSHYGNYLQSQLQALRLMIAVK